VSSPAPPPPLTALADLPSQLAAAGFAVLDAAGLAALVRRPRQTVFAGWAPHWSDLPPDTYLRDGGRYRRRRHGCFVIEPAGDGAAARQVVPAPHRAHWQPLDYNALHGGIERWFEPLPTALAEADGFHALLEAMARVADGLRPAAAGAPWFAEAHAFRIDASEGIGRPTPEGAHRDGVDLVAVMLVGRHGVKGGETRVFDAHGPQGMRFTLAEPFSVLLLDDARVIHETTPIQPVQAGASAYRDTLVLTLRAGGFQGPGEA
jgi:hypothetical protein